MAFAKKTEYIKITPENLENSAERAAEILQSGGLVAIPTETVYGLAGNALDGNIVKKIYTAKGRPSDNPLIVHVNNFEEAEKYWNGNLSKAKRLAEAFWPGPLTIILPKNEKIPPETSGGLDTVAIRCPEDKIAKKIIEKACIPLAAPSANSSGKPSPTSAKYVFEDLDGKIDMIIDGGECSVGVESTVISLAEKKPKLLRPGGITLSQLEEALGEKVEVDDAVLHMLKKNQTVSSPGMKYKHYSPLCDITMVSASDEDFCNFVNKREAFSLCFEENTEKIKNCLALGKRCDMENCARLLFERLRELDEKNIPLAFVQNPETDGVALAVYNRLIRACAFKKISVHRGKHLVIGLTGQSGAGKGAVSAALSKYGFIHIDTDKIAHEAYKKGSEAYYRILRTFGPGVAKEGGEISRFRLGKIVFSNPKHLEKLNAIVHPFVTNAVKKIIKENEKNLIPGIILDAPALFESGENTLCDFTVFIKADENTRIKRIMKRDNITEEDAKKRVRAQYADSFFEKRSDLVVENFENCDIIESVSQILNFSNSKKVNK